MGQADVLRFLQEQRKENENWFRITQIKEALAEKGLSNSALKMVSKQVQKLAIFGLIDYKGIGVWDHSKVFRAKRIK